MGRRPEAPGVIVPMSPGEPEIASREDGSLAGALAAAMEEELEILVLLVDAQGSGWCGRGTRAAS